MARNILQCLDELGMWLSDTTIALDIAQKAKAKNPWFNEESVLHMLNGISSSYLNFESLKSWESTVSFNSPNSKVVGVVCAGNIPAVGFHDLLSIILSPHTAIFKLSSKDDVILPMIWEQWIKLWPDHVGKVVFEERLNDVDALIATGSDEMKAHFEHYFKDIPKLLRGHRNGIALLTGEETISELEGLGNDVFLYYGLGCRNVSMVWAPKDYDWSKPLSVWEKQFSSLTNAQKYMNNYDYNKTLLLMNRVPHLSSTNLNVVESESMHSRISTLHVAYYESPERVAQFVFDHASEIQCITGNPEHWSQLDIHNFGYAQQPELTDYADGVNTLSFLAKL